MHRINGILRISLLTILLTASGLKAANVRIMAQFHSEDVFETLSAAEWNAIGVEDIIVRVFRNDSSEGGLFFRNSYFKTLDNKLDLLIKRNGNPGYGIWGWMIARRFDWISDEKMKGVKFQSGKRKINAKIDIFNPMALDKLKGVFSQLSMTAVRGILIQDDLIIKQDEGFSKWGMGRFTAVTKVPAVEKLMKQQNTPYGSNWIRVKINQINDVADSIARQCHAVKPGIKVGMNVYYEAPLNPEGAERWYAHSLGELAATDIDQIFLMAYHRQIAEELKLNKKQTHVYFRKMLSKAAAVCGSKLAVKLQIRDWKSGKRIPLNEMEEYLRLLPQGIRTVCFTPVKTEDLRYMRDMIKKTRSVISELKYHIENTESKDS